MISENEAYQRQLGGCTAVPNGDELRRIAISARTSASDDASPIEYVLAGWKAAMLAASTVPQQKPVGEVQHLHELNDSWLNKLPVGTKLYTAPQQWVLEPVAIVVECGNLYAKVKLNGEAFGTTKVGDEFYRAPQPASVSSDTLYLLRRLLSNQHTLTGPEFRAELEKIVGEAYQQEAQEPCPSCRNSDIYACTCPFPTSRNAAPQPAPAPLSDDAKDVVRDAAFEAVRKKLCALPRFSFLSDGYGAVRRIPDKSGSWIAFDAAHELFDPVAVDAALTAQGENT